jgi:hypothetical protein
MKGELYPTKASRRHLSAGETRQPEALVTRWRQSRVRLFERHEAQAGRLQQLAAEAYGHWPSRCDPRHPLGRDPDDGLRRLKLPADRLDLAPFRRECRGVVFRDYVRGGGTGQHSPKTEPHAVGVMALPVAEGPNQHPGALVPESAIEDDTHL